jgi:uncharacterized secreted protein with C-terminal beta-propeller domain
MGSHARTGARRRLVPAIAVTGLLLAGCAVHHASSPVTPPSGLRLVAYDGCPELLDGLRNATAAHVGPYGLAGDPIMRPLPRNRLPADAGAAQEQDGPQHSTTNVQEPGIDEPDLVKTDGRRIVTVSGGRLHVIDAATRRETGTLNLAERHALSSGELLLSGDRALVVVRERLIRPLDDVRGMPVRDPGPRLVLVDLTGPRVIASMTADGSYIDARQTGSIARVVVRSAPRIEFPPHPSGDATAANREAVRRAPVEAWLPRYSVTRGGRTRQLNVPCDQVSHPPTYTGTSLISVLTLDLRGDLGDAAPISVAAGGQTVYGSAAGLYVTDQQATRAGATRTDIYRFDVRGSARPRFTASGSVSGALLGPYALSEYGGNLRVATTTSRLGQDSQSAVHVLGPRLEPVGRVGGLGRGERIYAVRFIGPAGYVVTFRQTDPLYVLDLRNARSPRAVGELKISGYSAYLHPTGDGRLIGVGQEADANGRPLGTQVSLFDVRDPAHPRKVDGYRLGPSTSAVEASPHAFLYWPGTGMTVVPVTGTGVDGALVLSVTAKGVRRLGMVSQPANAGGVQRTMLVGGTLWTLSATALQANDATTLTRSARVPLT